MIKELREFFNERNIQIGLVLDEKAETPFIHIHTNSKDWDAMKEIMYILRPDYITSKESTS